MNLAVVFMAAVAGGIVQAVTGFGSGIVMMIFFPLILPVLNASALSSAIGLAAAFSMAWTYRRHIRVKPLLWPAVFYVAVSTAVISYITALPAELILKILGGVLIILSIYFLRYSDRVHVKDTPLSAVVCASMAGGLAGMFGIGGPPMALYMSAAIPEKEAYLGSIQFFFFLTNIHASILRIYKGIYTLDLLPLSVAGILGVLAGAAIGNRIVDRINAATMRKLIYLFLGFTGIINLL